MTFLTPPWEDEGEEKFWKSGTIVKVGSWGVKLEDRNSVGATRAASAPSSCRHSLVKLFRFPYKNHPPGKVFNAAGWQRRA